MASHPRRITRALLSVSDKTGLVDFARALAGYGVELVSTGGTAKALKEPGLTVHRRLRAHRLSRDDGRPRQDAAPEGARRPAGDPRQHRSTPRRWQQHGIKPIDLLVVNLYPFEATVAKGAAFDDCIENIDIGGPAMIRAAAKNHADVAVVVDAGGLRRGAGGAGAARRHDLARAAPAARRQGLCAHRRLRRGDLQLVRRHARRRRAGLSRLRRQAGRAAALRRKPAPERGVLSHAGRSASASPPRGSCRARSSPTTTSTTPTRPTNASPSSTRSAPRPASSSSTPTRAASPKARACSTPTSKALACDPTSAFGGIVALNRTLDAEAAKAITEIFTEVIIAPDADRGSDRDRRRRRRTCGCCSPAACPIRAPPA